MVGTGGGGQKEKSILGFKGLLLNMKGVSDHLESLKTDTQLTSDC